MLKAAVAARARGRRRRSSSEMPRTPAPNAARSERMIYAFDMPWPISSPTEFATML
jgi:hypothetical protein